PRSPCGRPARRGLTFQTGPRPRLPLSVASTDVLDPVRLHRRANWGEPPIEWRQGRRSSSPRFAAIVPFLATIIGSIALLARDYICHAAGIREEKMTKAYPFRAIAMAALLSVAPVSAALAGKADDTMNVAFTEEILELDYNYTTKREYIIISDLIDDTLFS